MLESKICKAKKEAQMSRWPTKGKTVIGEQK